MTGARIALLIGVVLVMVLSLLPAPALPPVTLWDKLQHGAAYAMLAASGAAGFPSQRGLIVVSCCLATLGGLLELAQRLASGREASSADWFANLAGIGLVFLIAIWIHKRTRGRDDGA